DRSGLAVRGGVALDRPLAVGLSLGIGLDAEYYGLKVTGNSSLDTSVHTGADILGSLRLRFEIGICCTRPLDGARQSSHKQPTADEDLLPPYAHRAARPGWPGHSERARCPRGKGG